MIWRHTKGSLSRFIINWWSDSDGFGAAIYIPIWETLSCYWDYSSMWMLLGFRLRAVYIGFDFDTVKISTATELSDRIRGVLKYRILLYGLFHSMRIIYGTDYRSIGNQTKLYSMRELRDRRI